MGESLQQVSRAAERASKLTGQLLTLSPEMSSGQTDRLE